MACSMSSATQFATEEQKAQRFPERVLQQKLREQAKLEQDQRAALIDLGRHETPQQFHGYASE